MRIPTRSFEDGVYDPRLHSKEFPPDDVSNDGHFAAAAAGVTRRLTFDPGTGDRWIEFWRTPTVGEYIIEGAVIALQTDWAQSGVAQAMRVSVEIERKPGSGWWLTLAQGMLMEQFFSGGAYDTDTQPSVFGLRAWQVDSGTDNVESPHRAFDGAVELTAQNAFDLFTPFGTQGWSHGIAPDEPIAVHSRLGTFPAGLVAGRYYKRGIGTENLEISTTIGGAAVNITNDGTPPFGVTPIERGVVVSRDGIYVGANANRFRGGKVRFRCRPAGGSNTWSGTAQVSLQMRMIK